VATGELAKTPQERVSFLQEALELGITTIDQADIYGDYQSERLLGEALHIAPELKKEFQFVSKCGIKLVSQHRPEHHLQHYDTSRQHIIASAENSLRAMQIDRLDLLLIHRPDPLMDADEMAEHFSIYSTVARSHISACRILRRRNLIYWHHVFHWSQIRSNSRCCICRLCMTVHWICANDCALRHDLVGIGWRCFIIGCHCECGCAACPRRFGSGCCRTSGASGNGCDCLGLTTSVQADGADWIWAYVSIA
jgi:hypothetical protein